MTIVQRIARHSGDEPAYRPRTADPGAIRIGLLGLGHVGSAVARMTASRPATAGARIEVAVALVRDRGRSRSSGDVARTTDPGDVFSARPTVVVEALGGLEPARTLIIEAIARGVPVVTANKSVIAHHGDEILAAATRAGVPVLYEASVIAGVPFLCTFARRPHASSLSAITGIVNGTTNFILSEMNGAAREYGAALADAQRRGLAEPDPAMDVTGVDAAEKLTILIRQFTGHSVEPRAIETTGIDHVAASDFAAARALGGTLKPVVQAAGLASHEQRIEAFSGPAFVPAGHPLERVHHVANALCLTDVAGSELCFSGPGAGPDVTARTLLDDVIEAASMPAGLARATRTPGMQVVEPSTPWLLHLSSSTVLPPRADLGDLLAAQGLWAERTSANDRREGMQSITFLINSCPRSRIARATAAVERATASTARLFRALAPVA
jgi:homoserine dehydrogenase